MNKLEGRRFTREKKLVWGKGPWVDEPDELVFEIDGYPCIIYRQVFYNNQLVSGHGALCGYIGVLLGHPWYGKDYDTIAARVHGGLTFSDNSARHLRYPTNPGEPDDIWWWIGFDCAHSDDYSPALEYRVHSFGYRRGELPNFRHGQEYRDVEYVRNECAELVRQAKAASPHLIAAPKSLKFTKMWC
jgi:hypothetical protein